MKPGWVAFSADGVIKRHYNKTKTVWNQTILLYKGSNRFYATTSLPVRLFWKRKMRAKVAKATVQRIQLCEVSLLAVAPVLSSRCCQVVLSSCCCVFDMRWTAQTLISYDLITSASEFVLQCNFYYVKVALASELIATTG